mmetsp:Transcript_11681/g.41725  ORF Transcript_11681/g.41725 Transcript_11681/m.41725 type:complete len:209 (+) Transcript_11681:3404-4030(+)
MENPQAEERIAARPHEEGGEDKGRAADDQPKRPSSTTRTLRNNREEAPSTWVRRLRQQRHEEDDEREREVRRYHDRPPNRLGDRRRLPLGNVREGDQGKGESGQAVEEEELKQSSCPQSPGRDGREKLVPKLVQHHPERNHQSNRRQLHQITEVSCGLPSGKQNAKAERLEEEDPVATHQKRKQRVRLQMRFLPTQGPLPIHGAQLLP